MLLHVRRPHSQTGSISFSLSRTGRTVRVRSSADPPDAARARSRCLLRVLVDSCDRICGVREAGEAPTPPSHTRSMKHDR